MVILTNTPKLKDLIAGLTVLFPRGIQTISFKSGALQTNFFDYEVPLLIKMDPQEDISPSTITKLQSEYSGHDVFCIHKSDQKPPWISRDPTETKIKGVLIFSDEVSFSPRSLSMKFEILLPAPVA